MADSKKPKNGKGKLKGPEDRVILQIPQELIEELDALADSKELSLRDYIRQLLKHKVVAKHTRDRGFSQFRESQKWASRPKIRGLPTMSGRVISSPNTIAPPDPFLYPDTDIARALVKRAMREQVLPQAWGYGRLSFIDREGLGHCRLDSSHFIDPLARDNNVRMKPFWKVRPGEQSDWLLSKIRQAIQGDPLHWRSPIEVDGRQLNFEIRVFELGKGLAALLVKSGWVRNSRSGKAPTEFDALSQYYRLRKRLELSGPQVVWWVQETGFITDYRSQIEETPLSPYSEVPLMHLEDFFDADVVESIMSHVHAASQTHEKQFFTLKETLENLWELNSYTIYPLNPVRRNERDVVMMTKNCLVSTILDPQKIYSVEWGEGTVD